MTTPDKGNPPEYDRAGLPRLATGEVYRPIPGPQWQNANNGGFFTLENSRILALLFRALVG